MFMHRFARIVARLVVHRPIAVLAATAGIVLACVWVLQSQQRFDSEILNLLPKQFESVQALKTLNNDFAQARELIFAVQGEPAAVEEFTGHLVEKLGTEPWVLRVFSGSPMESPEGLDTLGALLPRLLLNLEAAEFEDALRLLTSEEMSRRLRGLRAEMESGSMKAEMLLTADPLGLLGIAMKPMATVSSIESGRSLSSEDGTLAIVPVVTSQPSLSQVDCRLLMEQVDAFVTRVRASWPGAAAPEVLVTGRSAYVAQISASMKRDVQVTSTVSIVMVASLFYLGFRRLLPLAGIIVTLGLSCFVAFTLGCLLFENLNMVAIAFCSILVGLGDDFSLLLYNRYLQARAAQAGHEAAIATSIRDVGRGIIYVSVTTGIGFLTLLFSGSAGFAQLGALIALGILLCGAFMLTLLFLFIRPQMPVARRDPFGDLIGWYAQRALARPARLALPMLAVFVAAFAVAVLPVRQLRFDTSPRSLEPKDSPAAIALKVITEKIPAAAEPMVVLVESASAQDAHDRWQKLTAHLEKLAQSGDLAGYSGPVALLLSPERIRQNQERLRAFDLDAARAAFLAALEREGFNAEAFRGALDLFDQLKTAAEAAAGEELADVRNALPPASAWWFLIERYFSSKPHVAAAYLRPAQRLETVEQQEKIERRLKESGVPLQVTGWSYAMVSLVPWARYELVLFSLGVGGLILILLGIAYRQWRPWIIHAASLILAISATVATLKLLGIRINMLNALAFPLVLGVGVDYGLHVLLAARDRGNQRENLRTVLKPLVICGLTTITGFGSLILARNPALSGLGLVCALGVAWCLLSSLFFVLPFAVLRGGRPTTANSTSNAAPEDRALVAEPQV